MHTFLVIIHVIVCLIVIFVVLLQTGKGADIGASFGGGSQTIFGAQGAASFLTKLTAGAAALYMITSLGLSMVSPTSSSVMQEGAPAKKGMPANMPAGMPAGTPAMPSAPAPAGAPAPAQPAMPAMPQGAK